MKKKFLIINYGNLKHNVHPNEKSQVEMELIILRSNKNKK